MKSPVYYPLNPSNPIPTKPLLSVASSARRFYSESSLSPSSSSGGEALLAAVVAAATAARDFIRMRGVPLPAGLVAAAGVPALEIGPVDVPSPATEECSGFVRESKVFFSSA